MDNKITIIEGPPPTFEMTDDYWALGLTDSPNYAGVAVTRLRTFNGPSLVERCHTAWRHRRTIDLEFKTPEGLMRQAPIVAARTVETDEGDMLLLWVRLDDIGVEIEIGYESDDDEDNFDDNFDAPDLPF